MVGARSFSDEQSLACDVTGNGTVSALDASHILQSVVGLIGRLPVADLCGSDWAFKPIPTPVANQSIILPAATDTSCQRGQICYAPLSEAAGGQNFLGIVYGDCTGNWVWATPTPTPSVGGGQAAAWGRGDASAGVCVGPLRRDRTGRLSLPVYVEADAFTALEGEIVYDATRMQAVRVRRLRPTRAGLLAVKTTEAGRVRFALASAAPMEGGERPVLMVRFVGKDHRGWLPGDPAFTYDIRVD